MAPPTLVVIDLGDGFTKAIAVGPEIHARWRFPSVVARRLMRDPSDLRELTLGSEFDLLRPMDFDADAHPRTRSYPGAERFLQLLRDRPPEARARFAGGIAAVYGADRQTLGEHPTLANVDALVHKVLMLLARTSGSDPLAVRLVFVVDVGAKSKCISRWVDANGSGFGIDLCSYRDARPR